jgi:hypothetical protein
MPNDMIKDATAPAITIHRYGSVSMGAMAGAAWGEERPPSSCQCRCGVARRASQGAPRGRVGLQFSQSQTALLHVHLHRGHAIHDVIDAASLLGYGLCLNHTLTVVPTLRAGRRAPRAPSHAARASG